jgi:hypothetical protein
MQALHFKRTEMKCHIAYNIKYECIMSPLITEQAGTSADVSCGRVPFVKKIATVGYPRVCRWGHHCLIIIYGCSKLKN